MLSQWKTRRWNRWSPRGEHVRVLCLLFADFPSQPAWQPRQDAALEGDGPLTAEARGPLRIETPTSARENKLC